MIKTNRQSVRLHMTVLKIAGRVVYFEEKSTYKKKQNMRRNVRKKSDRTNKRREKSRTVAYSHYKGEKEKENLFITTRKGREREREKKRETHRSGVVNVLLSTRGMADSERIYIYIPMFFFLVCEHAYAAEEKKNKL